MLRGCFISLLLCTEDTVACVAYTGNDVFVLVELLVHNTCVDLYIGVSLLYSLNALRRADDAHELDMWYAKLFELSNSSNCWISCCKHRINDDSVTLFDIIRHLCIILHRLLCDRVTEKSDMTYLCSRNECCDTVYHAESCAEYRDKCKLSSWDYLCFSYSKRCFKFDLLQRKVSCSLIADEHCYLGYQLAELLCTCVLVSQQRDLVLYERMIYNV